MVLAVQRQGIREEDGYISTTTFSEQIYKENKHKYRKRKLGWTSLSKLESQH